MVSKFFKKWGFSIACLFTALGIFTVLYPTLFMGEEARERAEFFDTTAFILAKRMVIQDHLMAGESISSLEETPKGNRVIYFYRSTDGAMYIQTKKRAYFLVPIKEGNEIKWNCQSSDGSELPYGCLKD